MKIIFAGILVFSAASAVVIDESAAVPHLLRPKSSATGPQQHPPPQRESPCNAARDKESCFRTRDDGGAAGLPCEWCIAGAIPSECMSQDQAALLPAGVFDCAAPGRHEQQSHRPASFAFESEVFGYDQIYSLFDSDQPMKAAPQPTKSDLCDASSKSLAGYMDIKGSDYDQANENKHLFYWMFEKRGDDATAETPVRTKIRAARRDFDHAAG